MERSQEYRKDLCVFRLKFPVPLLTYFMDYFLQQSWRRQYCSATLVSSSDPSAPQDKRAMHAGPGLSMRGRDPQNGLGAQVSPALVPLYILTLGTELFMPAPSAAPRLPPLPSRSKLHGSCTPQLTPAPASWLCSLFNSLVAPLLAEARVKAAGLFMYWSQTFTYNHCSSNNN